MRDFITIDFETFGITKRPDFPPEPVGVAVKRVGRKARYYAWGHPTGNNCIRAEAIAAIKAAYATGLPIVGHNIRFDLAVADEKLGTPLPAPERIHDTMLLAFLNNPYEPTLALKPLAEKHLGLPPTERDAVQDWLVAENICRKNDKGWGAFIAYAPGDLVGAYAVGDVERTEQLFILLHDKITQAEMLEAYARERFLIPVLHENEKHGVRVDLDLMMLDSELYHDAMAQAEDWLRQRLGKPDMNIDSNEELADALAEAGVVTEFDITKTGKRSVAKNTMTREKFSDFQVFQVLGYRNRLQTATGTFLHPWIEMAAASGGWIFTSWRQTGAVTGRQSSSPNFQNIPKNWDKNREGWSHPAFIPGLPKLPNLRRYILPDEGEILVAADYAGQEVRVTAHYEGAGLRDAYIENPKLDPHAWVQGVIKDLTGVEYARDTCKIALFAILYGAGVKALASQLSMSMDDAAKVKRALMAALPGIAELNDELKLRAQVNAPYRTGGGRVYTVEPPKIVDGEVRRYDYKCLNTLIQGTSADQTKQAILDYHRTKRHGRFLLSVHDELLISVREEFALDETRVLIEAMCSALPLDVPMIAETKSGTNFAECK